MRHDLERDIRLVSEFVRLIIKVTAAGVKALGLAEHSPLDSGSSGESQHLPGAQPKDRQDQQC
jgi:hypothetical protein